MVVELIPTGNNTVVAEDGTNNKEKSVSVKTIIATKEDCNRYSPSEHVLSAITDLSNNEGTRYGNVVCTIKDAEADVLCTVKDAQADLERSGGLQYADIVKTIKDSEAELDRASSNRFMHTIKDIKDAEARLDRSSADRFIKTIEDVKESQFITEKTKAKIVQEIKDSELENLKAETRTREMLASNFREILMNNCEKFDDLGNKIQDARKEIQILSFEGFRDNALAFKDQAILTLKLHAETEKTAYTNQMQNLLQFKDQTLLSEKLAAQLSKEVSDRYNDLKEKIQVENSHTRDIINRIETDRLRDKATKAEAQLAAYFARGVAPVIPV